MGYSRLYLFKMLLFIVPSPLAHAFAQEEATYEIVDTSLASASEVVGGHRKLS